MTRPDIVFPVKMKQETYPLRFFPENQMRNTLIPVFTKKAK